RSAARTGTGGRATSRRCSCGTARARSSIPRACWPSRSRTARHERRDRGGLWARAGLGYASTMKRFLLVGCGLLVLAAGITLAILVWRIWPAFQELQSGFREFSEQIAALEREHPFEPPETLDAGRLSTVLDARVQLASHRGEF